MNDSIRSTAHRLSQIFGSLSFVTMLTFFGNVLIGRYRVATGTGTAAPLDGVPEFLILSLSIAFFVACMVYAERAEDGQEN